MTFRDIVAFLLSPCFRCSSRPPLCHCPRLFTLFLTAMSHSVKPYPRLSSPMSFPIYLHSFCPAFVRLSLPHLKFNLKLPLPSSLYDRLALLIIPLVFVKISSHRMYVTPPTSVGLSFLSLLPPPSPFVLFVCLLFGFDWWIL